MSSQNRKLLTTNMQEMMTGYCVYLFSFVETPRKFIIVELSIRKLGSSSVLIILLTVLLALMKIQAYGSKALQ